MQSRYGFLSMVVFLIAVGFMCLETPAAEPHVETGDGDALKADITAKKHNEPDAVFLSVSNAKSLFEQEQTAEALSLLESALKSLDKERLAKWQVLSNMKLCLMKLQREKEAGEIAAQAAQIAAQFELVPSSDFELIGENAGLRSAVDSMVKITALTTHGPQRLVRREGGFAVMNAATTEPPGWVTKFSTGAKLKQSGRYREAEPYLVQAAKEAEEQRARPVDLAAVYSMLGGEYRFLTRYDESIAAYKKALSISEKDNSENTANYAIMLDNLAQVYAQKHDYATTAALQKKALAIYEKVLPPDAHDLAETICNYAETLTHTGSLEEAEKTYMKGLAIYKATLPPDDLRLAFAYDNLGNLYNETNRLEKAESVRRTALGIFESKLGPTRPDVSICVNNLAHTLVAANKVIEAQQLMEEHLSILKKANSAQLDRFAQQYFKLMASINSPGGH